MLYLFNPALFWKCITNGSLKYAIICVMLQYTTNRTISWWSENEKNWEKFDIFWPMSYDLLSLGFFMWLCQKIYLGREAFQHLKSNFCPIIVLYMYVFIQTITTKTTTIIPLQLSLTVVSLLSTIILVLKLLCWPILKIKFVRNKRFIKKPNNNL